MKKMSFMLSIVILAFAAFMMQNCSGDQSPEPDNLNSISEKLKNTEIPEASCATMGCPTGKLCAEGASGAAFNYLNTLSDNNSDTESAIDCNTVITGWDNFSKLATTGTPIEYGSGHLNCCYSEAELDQVWQDAYAWAQSIGEPEYTCAPTSYIAIVLEFEPVTAGSSPCSIDVTVTFVCVAECPEEEES